MLTCLLKRVLPFTLTFIMGAALGGFFFNPFGVRTKMSRVVRTELRYHGYGEGRSCRHRRFRQRELVAETKPLIILFKPDARLPREFREFDDGALFHFVPRSALVRVTFGADGKVQAVEPFYENSLGLNRLPLGSSWKQAWDSVERAARLIQFTPEMNNGLPVTATKELEIFFLPD
ncbi:MAG TPA: hypothetical protein VEX60_05135 [Pyrinomonadaceae bacterium]|nr:hypothetical protein [Pyrinomonadaceae bacterium]